MVEEMGLVREQVMRHMISDDELEPAEEMLAADGGASAELEGHRVRATRDRRNALASVLQEVRDGVRGAARRSGAASRRAAAVDAAVTRAVESGAGGPSAMDPRTYTLYTPTYSPTATAYMPSISAMPSYRPSSPPMGQETLVVRGQSGDPLPESLPSLLRGLSRSPTRAAAAAVQAAATGAGAGGGGGGGDGAGGGAGIRPDGMPSSGYPRGARPLFGGSGVATLGAFASAERVPGTPPFPSSQTLQRSWSGLTVMPRAVLRGAFSSIIAGGEEDVLNLGVVEQEVPTPPELVSGAPVDATSNQHMSAAGAPSASAGAAAAAAGISGPVAAASLPRLAFYLFVDAASIFASILDANPSAARAMGFNTHGYGVNFTTAERTALRHLNGAYRMHPNESLLATLRRISKRIVARMRRRVLRQRQQGDGGEAAAAATAGTEATSDAASAAPSISSMIGRHPAVLWNASVTLLYRPLGPGENAEFAPGSDDPSAASLASVMEQVISEGAPSACAGANDIRRATLERMTTSAGGLDSPEEDYDGLGALAECDEGDLDESHDWDELRQSLVDPAPVVRGVDSGKTLPLLSSDIWLDCTRTMRVGAWVRRAFGVEHETTSPMLRLLVLLSNLSRLRGWEVNGAGSASAAAASVASAPLRAVISWDVPMLADRVRAELSDAVSVMACALPPWALVVSVRLAPLLPLSVRETMLALSMLGLSRAAHRLQSAPRVVLQGLSVTAGGDGGLYASGGASRGGGAGGAGGSGAGGGSGADGRDGPMSIYGRQIGLYAGPGSAPRDAVLGTLKKMRFVVDREPVLPWAKSLMRVPETRRTEMEVAFRGERGFGVGVTLEWYAMVASRLTSRLENDSVPMWTTSQHINDLAVELVCDGGLHPAALPDDILELRGDSDPVGAADHLALWKAAAMEEADGDSPPPADASMIPSSAGGHHHHHHHRRRKGSKRASAGAGGGHEGSGTATCPGEVSPFLPSTRDAPATIPRSRPHGHAAARSAQNAERAAVTREVLERFELLGQLYGKAIADARTFPVVLSAPFLRLCMGQTPRLDDFHGVKALGSVPQHLLELTEMVARRDAAAHRLSVAHASLAALEGDATQGAARRANALVMARAEVSEALQESAEAMERLHNALVMDGDMYLYSFVAPSNPRRALRPGGEMEDVTTENVRAYVMLATQYLCMTSMSRQAAAFRQGFSTVCASLVGGGGDDVPGGGGGGGGGSAAATTTAAAEAAVGAAAAATTTAAAAVTGETAADEVACKSMPATSAAMLALRLLTPAEWNHLAAGDGDVAWDAATLEECLVATNGYDKRSPPFRFLIAELAEMNVSERRAFLKFATGTPHLPAGGLSALRPPLTVVEKRGAGDDALTSVSTCLHFTKLPPYSSREVLKTQLARSIAESEGVIDIS